MLIEGQHQVAVGRLALLDGRRQGDLYHEDGLGPRDVDPKHTTRCHSLALANCCPLAAYTTYPYAYTLPLTTCTH